MVANEINKRHEFIMNPTGSSAVQTTTSAAFTYYLAVSPAAALVNLSQTVIIGVPVLAAYHGGAKGFARAGAQLMGALKDFTLGGGQAERSRHLTEDEKRAMDAGYRTGIIDRTQSHDLAGIGETGVEYRPGRAKVMAAISWAFHHAERLNREVTFLAAYRIARQKGLDHEGAVLKAGDLTWKTHFDYQNTSRPRMMHSDTAKALLVFRNYNVNMLYRLFRDTHQALHGESKEIRREALTQLSGITAMMMANAGIKGTWMFGIAMVLAGFFLDDGDDPEQELKKAMVEAVGPMMAGLAMDGIPGYLTDTSLSGRVGMPDLWFRSPDRQLEGEDSYNYWLGQVVGAAPGIVENMLRGIGMIKEGKTYRGVETIAPTFITNLMRA
ncbi:PLxRFG domain-containing protein [Martelella alba]|uniref:PLxRFG domain-containing protein n=1 Tax=Martelella alba TaxID=2590451 RepID=A0A506UF67_9HYPH|nr:PLxRFG domain-containing protein [Martelella alba]TPW31459.1 PLxRFG domain-containing protein [Martelella alba]